MQHYPASAVPRLEDSDGTEVRDPCESRGRKSDKQEESVFPLLSSPESFYLHPFFFFFICFVFEKRTKSHRRDFVREDGLQGFC